jgi:hypothetical protein
MRIYELGLTMEKLRKAQDLLRNQPEPEYYYLLVDGETDCNTPNVHEP